MTLRVLLLEDRDADAELAVAHLKRAGFDVMERRVDSARAYDEALTEFTPDVVLCDHGVSGFAALDALRMLKDVRPHAAFVMVTGALDLPSTVACLKAGADDLVLKTDLTRLAPAVRGALDERAALTKLSPRQLEVLRLAVEGLTTRAIAERLGLSLKTVETHRTELMRRLDVHDIASLVRFAVKVRLIPPDR